MGFLHIYTGDGKGKTTAAFGLALRALGNGKRVFIGQFLKHEQSGEVRALLQLPGVDHALFGVPRRVHDPFRKIDADGVAKGIIAARSVLESDSYDLVILDELVIALARGLIDLEEVLSLAAARTERCELVMTGRHAPQSLMDAADLVTDMTCVAHYARRGIPPRKGVEL